MEQPPCKACGGSGREIDHAATGKSLRALRESQGIKMCHVASRMAITSSQLSMLEAGQRHWRPETIAQYRAILADEPPTPAA